MDTLYKNTLSLKKNNNTNAPNKSSNVKALNNSPKIKNSNNKSPNKPRNTLKKIVVPSLAFSMPEIIETNEMKEYIPLFVTKSKAIQYYQLAHFVGKTFSKDPTTKVACILLSPVTHQVLSMGYNGIPRGISQTIPRWERPGKYTWVSHAETNAIFNASILGTPLGGCISVTSLFPCNDCARALIQIGVKALVTTEPNFNDPKWGEQFKISLLMFKEAHITVYYASYDTSYHITASL